MSQRLIHRNKVQLNDINLSYLIKEATEPPQHTVIFIHGFPFNKKSWRPQLETLPPNITGISVDVRGHGASTKGHGFFSVDVFAKDIVALISTLDLHKVVLCGVSMGGYIALRMYQLIPDTITGLILSDTHHRADDNAAKQKRFDSIQALLKHGKRPFSIGFIDNLFADCTALRNQGAIELIKKSINDNSMPNICATMLALAARTDCSESLKSIGVPTLLIRGVEDKITPRALMEEMCQNIPNAEFIEIQDAGHLPNLEQAGTFNKELHLFLTKLP